jgi:hypothetical protein
LHAGQRRLRNASVDEQAVAIRVIARKKDRSAWNDSDVSVDGICDTSGSIDRVCDTSAISRTPPDVRYRSVTGGERLNQP